MAKCQSPTNHSRTGSLSMHSVCCCQNIFAVLMFLNPKKPAAEFDKMGLPLGFLLLRRSEATNFDISVSYNFLTSGFFFNDASSRKYSLYTIAELSTNFDMSWFHGRRQISLAAALSRVIHFRTSCISRHSVQDSVDPGNLQVGHAAHFEHRVSE